MEAQDTVKAEVHGHEREVRQGAGGGIPGRCQARPKGEELRTARTGDAYLMLELSDRTGSIPGVLFRPSGAAIDVPVGSVVKVEGSVTSYRGARRITLASMGPPMSGI